MFDHHPRSDHYPRAILCVVNFGSTAPTENWQKGESTSKFAFLCGFSQKVTGSNSSKWFTKLSGFKNCNGGGGGVYTKRSKKYSNLHLFRQTLPWQCEEILTIKSVIVPGYQLNQARFSGPLS